MDTAIDLIDAFFEADKPALDAGDVSREDDRLIREAANGDDAAFGRLVERFQDQIYHFCYQWLGDAEDAQEACQDTFVQAYQALGRYEKRGRFTTWLYRIALNQCRDRHKSKASRNRRNTRSIDDDHAGELVCSNPMPDQSTSNHEQLEELRQRVGDLPEKLRAPIVLCCMEGMSQQEAAAVLKCSVRAVESRLRRGRGILVDRWNESQGQAMASLRKNF